MDEGIPFPKRYPRVRLVAINDKVLPSPEAMTVSVLREEDLKERRGPLAANPLRVEKSFDFTTNIEMDPEKVFIKRECSDEDVMRSPCTGEHDFEENSDNERTSFPFETSLAVSMTDNRMPRCDISLHQSIQGMTDKEENKISTEELDKTMDTFNSRRNYSASKHAQYLQECSTRCSSSNSGSSRSVMRKLSGGNNSRPITDAEKVSSVHDSGRMLMVVIPRNKEIDKLAAELRASDQFREGNEVTSVSVARDTSLYKGVVITHNENRNNTEKIPLVKLRKINATGTWENASQLEGTLDGEIESVLGAQETILLMKRAGILEDTEVNNTQQTNKKEKCEKQNKNVFVNEDKINDNMLEVKKKSSEVEEQPEELHIAETDKTLDGERCEQEDNIPMVLFPMKSWESIIGLSSHVCTNCQAIFDSAPSLYGHQAHCPVQLHKPKTTLRPHTKSTLIKNDVRSNHIESTFTQKNLKAMKYSCKFCGKILSCKSIFLRHTAMHINGRKYWCHVCGKGFPVVNSLKRHLRSHGGDKSYQMCKISYPTKRAMQFHKLKAAHHSTEENLETTPKDNHLCVINCTFQCDICEKTFLTLENLNKHKNIHTKCPSGIKVQRKSIETDKTLKTKCMSDSDIAEKKENRLCCHICDKEFSNNFCLKDHHHYHIGGTTFRCDSCQVAYRTADGLRHHHDKVHIENSLLSCKYCRKSFSSHNHLDRHECTNARVEYPCEHCQKVFPTDESLNLHKVMHVQQLQHESNNNEKLHNTETKLCLVCGKMLSSMYYLKRHILAHLKEKPHKCEVCGEKFTNAYSCKIHENVHTRESIKCDICESIFSEIQALEQHKKLHRKEHLFTNDLCTKAFSLQRYRNNGEISNIQITSTCNICNKSFATTDAWKVHSLIHLKNLFEFLPKNIPPRKKGGKKFSCSICGMILQTKGGYYRHRFLHTGKPLVCEICGKKFSVFSRFQDHIISHSAEKPYQCNECPKKYASRKTLQKHKQIHSERNKLASNTTLDQGPYKCGKCNSTFIKHSMLLRHKCYLDRTVKLFHCEICSQSFSTNLNLRIHYKTHFQKTQQSCL